MFYVLLFCLIGTSLCQFQQIIDLNEDHWEPESPAAKFLGLSSGASKVVPHIKTSFSCIGRRYGYFADVDNNCQIFHICHPSVAANGAPVIYHYSKFCPKHTRFDQNQLTCVAETSPKILPCIDSLRFYPISEARFAEIPIVHKGFEQIPEWFEQREELIPFEQVKLDTLPTKSIVRNVAIPKSVVHSHVIAQPVVQPVVHKPLPILAQRKLIQQRVVAKPIVQQLVSPVVSQVIKETNIPSNQVYSGFSDFERLPVQQVIQSQVQPSFLSVPNQQIGSIQQSVVDQKDVNIQGIPQSLLTLQNSPQFVPQSVQSVIGSAEQAQTVGQTFGQTFSVQQSAVKPVEQPVVQSVPQSQAFSFSQSSVEHKVEHQAVPQPLSISEQSVQNQSFGQPIGLSVQETTIHQKEEGIIQRPTQNIPSAVESVPSK